MNVKIQMVIRAQWYAKIRKEITHVLAHLDILVMVECKARDAGDNSLFCRLL